MSDGDWKAEALHDAVCRAAVDTTRRLLPWGVPVRLIPPNHSGAQRIPGGPTAAGSLDSPAPASSDQRARTRRGRPEEGGQPMRHQIRVKGSTLRL